MALTEGTYDVIVLNKDGKYGILENGFEVYIPTLNFATIDGSRYLIKNGNSYVSYAATIAEYEGYSWRCYANEDYPNEFSTAISYVASKTAQWNLGAYRLTHRIGFGGGRTAADLTYIKIVFHVASIATEAGALKVYAMDWRPTLGDYYASPDMGTEVGSSSVPAVGEYLTIDLDIATCKTAWAATGTLGYLAFMQSQDISGGVPDEPNGGGKGWGVGISARFGTWTEDYPGKSGGDPDIDRPFIIMGFHV